MFIYPQDPQYYCLFTNLFIYRCHVKKQTKNNRAKPLLETKNHSWTEEDLHFAMDYVKSEWCSLISASLNSISPYKTFKERMNKNNIHKPRMGNAAIHPEKRKDDLVQHILLLSNLLYGVTPKQLRILAYQCTEANNIKHSFNKNSKMSG